MKIDILTLFPKMFEGPFRESIIKRAQDKFLVEINIHDLRKWGLDDRRTVDDRPYGGGPGMIMRVDVVDVALRSLITDHRSPTTKVILLDAGGKRFAQQKAQELSKLSHIILIAGHYEGIDHRVHEHLVDEIISIGDYVLTGGEIPAMVIIDSVVRLIPGVVGKEASIVEESHSRPGYTEYPQYTRPEEFNSWKVPEVLLSGNHKKIKNWRQAGQ
ncbi:MAG: tRNA (guanosine(37)-N1)-methyltransferase TrmD [Candidatus Woesebacteria bacterium]|nr:tRNA (guanosine(37)-N1)-methyltransferase TrmD [Candidatus Woesebacteria bacterium]